MLAGLVVLAGVCMVLRPATTMQPAQTGQVACTLEAKICPDGTAVGRTGPDCAFAACPVSASPDTTNGPIGIGQNLSLSGLVITPLEVMDDSRCPTDVQCIWAGTVHVRARVMTGTGSTEMTFTLGEPVTTEAGTITLSAVTPAPHSGETILQADYRLIFDVVSL